MKYAGFLIVFNKFLMSYINILLRWNQSKLTSIISVEHRRGSTELWGRMMRKSLDWSWSSFRTEELENLSWSMRELLNSMTGIPLLHQLRGTRAPILWTKYPIWADWFIWLWPWIYWSWIMFVQPQSWLSLVKYWSWEMISCWIVFVNESTSYLIKNGAKNKNLPKLEKNHGKKDDFHSENYR